MKTLLSKLSKLAPMGTLALSIWLSGCRSSSDAQKVVDQTNREIAQDKSEVDKAASDAKEAAKKAADQELDATAGGGEPGKIELAGGFWQLPENKLNSQITVHLLAGKGWRGTTPTGSAGTLEEEFAISPTDQKSLDGIADQSSYLIFGCPESALQRPEIASEIAGKKAAQIQVTGPSLTLSAQTVILCGQTELEKNRQVSVLAGKIVFYEFSLTVTGVITTHFNVVAQELSLFGKNSIVSKGVDGETTVLAGPAIRLAAEKLVGAGQLDIQSHGANYLPSAP